MSKIKIDKVNPFTGQPTKYSAWTLYDEATHRGGNYADHWIAETKELMQDEGMTLHSVMKQAYLQGFIHGFEHKFDQTNYEEK